MKEYLLVWAGAIVGIGTLAILALGIFYLLKYLDRNIKSNFSSFKESEFDRKILIKIHGIYGILRRIFPLPRPTEASLFVSALTLFLIAFTYSEFWQEVSYLTEGEKGGEAMLGIIFIFCAAGYSIFHAFSNRAKTESEMRTLKYFSVITLILASVSSSIYIINTKEFGFILFSALNIIQALNLMFFSGKKYIGENVQLSDRNADRIEILLGTILVLVVFGIEKYIYNTHWSIVFSFTLFCWSLIASFLQRDDAVV